jgi:hypothetical protein
VESRVYLARAGLQSRMQCWGSASGHLNAHSLTFSVIKRAISFSLNLHGSGYDLLRSPLDDCSSAPTRRWQWRAGTCHRHLGLACCADDRHQPSTVPLALMYAPCRRVRVCQCQPSANDRRLTPMRAWPLLLRRECKAVDLQPAVILAHGTPATAAFQRETWTIPIVFAVVSDPVGVGFVAGLPRPGGNLTGFIHMEASMGGKWLELLTEIAPGVKRATIMFSPG